MISLIFCGDLKYCPYVKRYEERLKLYNIDYQIVFWNRSGESIKEDEHYVYYNEKSKLNSNKFIKAIDFVNYRKWLMDYIRRVKPDKCVLLSTLTGVILGDFLIKNGIPYIFDIRDYSYEHFKPYYDIEKRIIDNSIDTVISSKGFKNFLPKDREYIIAHNFNREDIISDVHFKKNDKIRFVWNGLVRYFDYQSQIIMDLANDCRYEMIYHGDGPELELYKDFCAEKNIKNIYFTGKYDNKEKSKLLKDADVLNNCYGYLRNEGNKLKYAVSNRFYDGLIYRIPQLVEESGYKTDWTEESKVGLAYKKEGSFADILYDYYDKLDEHAFENACSEVLRGVIDDDDIYISCIDRFVR